MRVLLTVLLVFLVSGCTSRPPPGLGQPEAVALLDDFFSGDAAQSDFTQRDVAVTAGAKHFQTTWYVPNDPARSALILIPGLTPQGRQQRKLVLLAKAFARHRVLVISADIPGLKALRMSPQQAADIASLAKVIRTATELPAESALGIGAISYAGGMAIIAATDPQVSAEVDFVVTVGGYFDIHNVIRYITTGHAYNSDTRRVELIDPSPDRLDRWSFGVKQLEFIKDKKDRVALAKYFRQEALRTRLFPTIPTDLGKDAQAVLNLVTNRDAARVDRLITDLPVAIRQSLAALNPAAHDLDCLTAHLILVHGAKDNKLPAVESRALAAQFSRDQAQLFILDSLRHTRFEVSSQIWREFLPVVEAVLAQQHRADLNPSDTCKRP